MRQYAIVGLLKSTPASAYSFFRSAVDLNVPSSFAALAQGMLRAPGICPARCAVSFMPGGAMTLPENSSGERTSTRFEVGLPTHASTSRRYARNDSSGVGVG